MLEYIATFDGKTKFLSIEKFEFNDDSKIYKASAFYGPQIEQKDFALDIFKFMFVYDMALIIGVFYFSFYKRKITN